MCELRCFFGMPGKRRAPLFLFSEDLSLEFGHAQIHAHEAGLLVQRDHAHYRRFAIEHGHRALAQHRLGANDGFHGKIGNINAGKHPWVLDGIHHAARNSKQAPACCMGLRCVHERSTSARRRMPCSSAAWLTMKFAGTAGSFARNTRHPCGGSAACAESLAYTASRSRRTTSEAQVFAQDSCSTNRSTVAVGSTARRKRNHEFIGTRRALCGGMSPRSSTTMPNPPPCSRRSVTFKICSKRPNALRCDVCRKADGWICSLQRIHNSRSRSTPAAAAEAGSKRSLASTSTHTSCRRVASPKAASITPVRPEEAGPTISLSAPRGSPPVRASSCAMPMGTVIGAARSRSSKVEPSCLPSDDSSWARRVAADGMRDLRDGRIGGEVFSLFIRLTWDSATGNLGCQPLFRSPVNTGSGGSLGCWIRFAIIVRVTPAWRYRLGVRTEDSQSSNPGSIPGSATNSSFFRLLLFPNH